MDEVEDVLPDFDAPDRDALLFDAVVFDALVFDAPVRAVLAFDVLAFDDDPAVPLTWRTTLLALSAMNSATSGALSFA
ncbi:hypothetical protein [Homoserinimonas aerilata]|uniref:hypothetical protein n=1 Tax=Homoserinimonas aerilata TaxID=1162970 RepID=UPI00163A55B1|nr:hypothetical protein [Homoserinimonas aerilata]